MVGVALVFLRKNVGRGPPTIAQSWRVAPALRCGFYVSSIKKKQLHFHAAAFALSTRLCRFAGIPNLTVQGGHSQFNFGFIGLATRTPIEQNSATDAHKWFKEYMAIANTAGDLSLP